MPTLREDRPYMQFNFKVEINGKDGGFQEISGVGTEVAVSKYRRVALGRVKYSSSGTAPVFGNIRITEIQDGEVHFTFDGYTKPAGQHDYVVQALGSYTGGKSEPAVLFAGFDDQGCLYKVTRSGKGVSKNELEAMEFQVEVALIVKQN